MNSSVFRIVLLTVSMLLLFTALQFIILNLGISNVNGSNIDGSYTVIVDAGHGGEDGGAIATDGTYEKDYNLDIAVKLEKILKVYNINVIMTRTEDTMTCDKGLVTQREKKVSDIRNRLKMIKSSAKPIFVSIHQNKFSDSNQKGAQVFYSPNNIKSKILADSIQNSISSTVQINNKRKTKPSGTEIYLLYHSTVPSVLVECGFLSNEEDLFNLKNDDYRTEIAFIIADGIIKFINQ